MLQRELSVTKRSQAGSSAAGRLRRQGLVPAVL
jgi:ribosomal protein L25 (general stress protein Ctc)